MRFDLQSIPVIDTHCHRVCPGREPKDFGNIGGGYCPGPGQNVNARQTILFGMMVDRLKSLYGMPASATADEVEKERYRRYGEDPVGYHAKMIEDANIAMFCNEIGSPLGGPRYTAEEVGFYHSIVPRDKRSQIVRIERVFDDLFDKKLSFFEYIKAFHEQLDREIKEEDAIGLKTVIAYYGGLGVEVMDTKAAEAAYKDWVLDGRGDPATQKRVHDHLVTLGLDAAIRHDLPIQIHTGTGASMPINLRTMSPVYLDAILKDERYLNKAKIVLLHCGYPYVEETGYLVTQFSNVYTDMSGTMTFSSVGAQDKIRALMERAPMNKIMYGSDGVNFPEVAWFGAHHFREQFDRVLDWMVSEKFFSESRAMDIANKVLFDNALGVYTKLEGKVSK